MRFSSVHSQDTFFVVMGVTLNKQAPYTEQGLFLKLSNNGLSATYKAVPDTNNIITGLFWNTLYTKDGSDFVFAGYGGDTTQHLVYGYLQSETDTIKIKRFYISNTYALQGLAVCSFNNHIYVTGVHNYKPGFDANIVLLKIDTAGDVVWYKFYDQLNMDYAQSITPLVSGNLMLGAMRNDLGQPVVKSNTWLLEVDTGGNIVRQWFDPNDSTYVAEGLRQTQDGGFIYGAQKKNYQSGFSPVSYNATIVKLDSNFNKQWTFIKGGNDLSIYSGITDIEELPDGSLVAAGHLTYYGTDTALNGYVVKLDVDGNVIWERNYRGINESQTLNFLSDIDILPDGGLIAVGQCQKSGATPPQVGWFLKLDSNGCEVENCLVGIQDQSSNFKNQSELHVYPNPATGQVQIQVENEMLSGELKIYDVAGSLLLQKKIEAIEMSIDVSSFAPGMYVVVAEKQGKAARSKLVVE